MKPKLLVSVGALDSSVNGLGMRSVSLFGDENRLNQCKETGKLAKLEPI